MFLTNTSMSLQNFVRDKNTFFLIVRYKSVKCYNDEILLFCRYTYKKHKTNIINLETMPKSIYIGTATKEQLRKADRRGSRDGELEADPSKGFKSTHPVHKSAKAYSRKPKHKGQRGW